MSDFLSNLVARSLGVAEVVRPRLASLFEPLQPALASTAGMLEEPTIREKIVSEALPPPAPAAPLVEPRPASITQDREHHTQRQRAVVPTVSDSPSRPTEGVRSASMSQATLAPTETGTRRPPVETPASPAARVHDVEHTFEPVSPPPIAWPFETEAVRRSSPDLPTERPAPIRHRGDAGEIPSRPAVRESGRTVSEFLDSSHEFRPSEVFREPTALPAQRPSARATIVVRPRVAQYAEPVSPAPSRQAATPEPTIHVTIGRVEVRATQPAALIAPRPRQARTAMSLDEYLRRRAKESRQ